MYYIPLSLIDSNPWQPRQAIDPESIAELAASIQQHAESRHATKGLLQLPAGRLVHPDGRIDDTSLALAKGARVQLAFGHRRKAAFELLGYPELPVELAEFTDEEMATMAWAENNDRADLTPIDRAKFTQKYIADFSLTQGAAAKKLNMSRPALANLLRLLDLPAEHQILVQEGKVSPRAAEALLQLQAVPEPVRRYAEANLYAQLNPSEIVKDAAQGASSDDLRSRINMMVERVTIELTGADFPLDAPIAGEGLRAAVCNECPDRVKHGKAWRCPDRDCYQLKRELYRLARVEAASAASGIAVLSPEVQKWATHLFYGDDGRAAAPRALERKCESLRLYYEKAGSPEYAYQTLAEGGFPDVKFTCTRKGECACRRAVAAGQDPDNFDPETAAQAQKEAEKKAKVNEKAVRDLQKESARVVAQALVDGNLAVWRQLLSHVAYSGNRKADEWDLERLQLEVASKIAPGRGYSTDPEAAREEINKGLEKLGLPEILPPGSLLNVFKDDAVDEILHRWSRVKGWLDKLDHTVPNLEAIQGNIANLAQIGADLDRLIIAGQASLEDPRLAEVYGDQGIPESIDRLNAMLEAGEEVSHAT